MKTSFPELTQRQAGWIAGIGLLLMTVLAIYASFSVFEPYIDFNDAGTTVKMIQDNPVSFRMSIFSYFLVIILDIVVAWALFYYFRSVHRSISLLTAWFRLIYSVIFAVALGCIIDASHLLGKSEYLMSFP